MRQKIVAGNWKMNMTFPESKEFLLSINRYTITNPSDVSVFVCPPAIYLQEAVHILLNNSVKVGAQDMSNYDEGAYTGEISAKMLKSINVDKVILGHSERREYHNEVDELIGKKIKKALEFKLRPIYCCGEKLEDRKNLKYKQVVENQIKTALYSLTPEEMSWVIIAYEPVWAIGTGEVATPEQAQEMHEFIRGLLSTHFGKEIAEEVPILYGGSVKPNNAEKIFSQPDVDGGLIGGASINLNDFTSIIRAMDNVIKTNQTN